MRHLDSPKPKSGTNSFTEIFEPEEEMSYRQVVAMFRALAQNPHMTRFAINAFDTEIGSDAEPTRSTSNDTDQLTRMLASETYENPVEWELDVAGNPRYRIGGAFHFDEKWSYVEYKNGKFVVLHKKQWDDITDILDEAEREALASA